jgi:2-amino-4-hydroxy-6-hydroxymethyldihydropteridine diphosphokinase
LRLAAVAFGTNLGDKIANLTVAIRLLSEQENIALLRFANIFETLPWGYTDQDNFYNTAVLLATKLSSYQLLNVLLHIEQSLGRQRSFKNAPRILDLDLIFYQDEVSNIDSLTLPHPLVCERDFVLAPLVELCPNYILENHHQSLEHIYRANFTPLLPLDYRWSFYQQTWLPL